MMTQNGYISETPVEKYKETIDSYNVFALFVFENNYRK